MRGRRPDPNAVKILKNNPGRRPLNDAEPRHATIDPECPAMLTDPAARAEWDRLIATLTTAGHVMTTDRGTLIAYCLKWAQWLALERATPAPGDPLFASTSNAAHRAYTAFMRAAGELGFTPSSRSRVVAAKATDDSPGDAFATFQRRLRAAK